MVSFALFLLASLSFYGLLANSRSAEAKARQTVAATAYARSLLERVRVQDFASLKLGTQTGSQTLATSRQGVTGQTVFRSRVTTSNGPTTQVKSVLVTVSWNQGRIEMETYVTP